MKIKLLLMIVSLLSLNAFANRIDPSIDTTRCNTSISMSSVIRKNIRALNSNAITYEEFLTLNSIRAYAIVDMDNELVAWCRISN